MNNIEVIRLSINSILSNRLRSLLTVLGIVIGVASVILLVSLVSGLKTFITGQIQGLGSNLMFVIPGRVGGSRSPGGVQANKLSFDLIKLLETGLRGEAKIAGIIQKSTTLKYQSKQDKGVAVFGVPANYLDLISIKIEKGRYFTSSEADSGKRVVVVGSSVQKNLFNGSSPIGKTINIANLKYVVIGVAASRGSTFGVDQDNSVLVPLVAAQKQFGIDKLNTIYVSANKPDQVKDVQKKVEKVILKRLSEDEFSVLTQEQTLQTIGQITSVLTVALAGVAAISLVVGGIGVMNIMLVSVTERTREIGLRKALGAREKDIRNQFLIEAMTLSSFGGLIGILTGSLLAFIASRFLTTTIPLWSILVSFGFSLAVGIIFGVAPAIRASKLDPIQALRYE